MSFLPKHNTNLVPCCLLLDCSGTMQIEIAPGFTRMDALNAGLQMFEKEVKSDPTVRNSVEVSIVDIGGKSAHKCTLIQPWVFAKDLQVTKLEANGSTPLAEGLIMALDIVDEKKQQYQQAGRNYYRPWIIVISDGEPTDSAEKWGNCVITVQKALKEKRALVITVAIDGCNKDKLNQVSGFKTQELSSHRFSEFFVWLSHSLGETSRSSDNTEQFVSRKKFQS